MGCIQNATDSQSAEDLSHKCSIFSSLYYLYNQCTHPLVTDCSIYVFIDKIIVLCRILIVVILSNIDFSAVSICI